MSLVAAKPHCTCPNSKQTLECPPYSELNPHQQRYVLQTVVPGEYGYPYSSPRPIATSPADCEELGQNCLGAVTYGTATCLASAIECTCGLLGGCVRAVSGPSPGRRRIDGQPYSWKAYEVGDWEYDMVVYRRPRRNFLQKLFDC